MRKLAMSNGQCAVSHALRANDPFGKYKPETQQPVRKLKVQGDETLRELKKVFKRFLRKKIKETQERGFFTEQDVAKEMIRGIFYTAEDVEKFSLALAEFQDKKDFAEKAGRFLSVLINEGKDSDYIVHTRHLEHISYIGIKNTKNITIEGHSGYAAAYGMSGGRIIVNGDVELDAGEFLSGGELILNGNATSRIGYHMSGGKIVLHGNIENSSGYSSVGDVMVGGEVMIFGNVNYSVGSSMKGGKITIYGNAGENIGEMMEGGEIHLEGDYKSLAGHYPNPYIDKYRAGLIFHKGKLILDRTTL